MGQSRVHSKGDGPSAWIGRFAPNAPAGAEVLDLACGGGRHGRLFLEQSHKVCFLDINLAGVADLASHPGAELLQADLENGSPWPLGNRRFGCIVVSNYLWRPLFPRIIAALEPGGLLLYETFMRGNERFGKPSNPDFLLAENELLEVCQPHCRIIAFEQGEESEPKPACRQRIAAVKT